MAAPVFWSLGYFREEGYSIGIFCPEGHGAELDLETAIARFGPALVATDHRDRFLAAFKCRICGKPGHSLTIQPPDIGTAGGGHSLS